MNDYRWKQVQVGDIVEFLNVKRVKAKLRGYVAKVLSIEAPFITVMCRGDVQYCTVDEIRKREKAYENIGAKVEVVSDCKSKGRTGVVVKTRSLQNGDHRITVQLDATSNLPSRKMCFECFSVRGV